MNKASVKRIFCLFLPVAIFCSSVVSAYAAIPIPKPNQHFTLTMRDMLPIFLAVFEHVMAMFPLCLMLFASYTIVRCGVYYFKHVIIGV